ncbi:MAG: GIY-YIG nuclease family protein [Candidatus Nitronauta litoralis]|uniref:GIY-YIG nuclease family protein n=1 Tax=Candidatus Nitronauta litoralis TaxID=2705533 RepID=A0A7T0BVT5_9BACT|nr:MAG: GIY-YIG nuclease family protein [Candidatus Nitronauta litoralis]
MKRYHVYILRCRDGSYYTGVTNDLTKRVWEHQNGLIKECYTQGRRPVELVFSEMFANIHHAIEVEKKIKGWNRQKKEALIERRFEDLPFLAKSKPRK